MSPVHNIAVAHKQWLVPIDNPVILLMTFIYMPSEAPVVLL